MFKILVVEDDKDLNQTVCAYLNRNGYEAIGCLSANDAYNEMYGNLFDMIISDIMMPQIDGFEFAKEVREMNQDIPILFMTAREDFESKRKGFGIGMCCTLVWADSFFVLGIVVGIIGMVIMGVAYPIYIKITEKQREKIAPQILELTEELSK